MCGACAGRGFVRDLIGEHRDNALLQVFGKCWMRDMFAEQLEADPRGVLRAEGVHIADDVAVTIEINRHMSWCGMCQLSFPRIEASAGIVDPGALFPANIRIAIDENAPSPYLTLVVGHHRHICTCDEYELFPFVYDS